MEIAHFDQKIKYFLVICIEKYPLIRFAMLNLLYELLVLYRYYYLRNERITGICF